MRLAVVIIGMATLTFASVAYTRSSRLKVRFAGRSRTAAPAQSKGIAENAGLSAEGLQQIAALLAEKESRTPEQRKLASQLLQAVRESRGQQMATGVTLEPAGINADNSGMVLVDITASVSDALLENIEKLGGEIIFPSAEYKAVRARIPLSTVETIAGYSEVTFIRQAAPATTSRSLNAAADDTVNRRNSLNSPDLAAPASPVVHSPVVQGSRRRLSFAERAANVRAQLATFLAARAPTATAFIGRANSQGDKAHQADTARAQYGFAGEGIRIGVMSDSFNFRGGLAADIAGGDLPGPGNPFGNTTPVTIVQDLPNPNPIVTGSDEGRAMMQIVHDLAPKAQLFFASAFISEAGFATNIKRLRDAPNNCDIVIDDVFYSDEGVFQDSIVARAVNYVTDSGGLYFSSAGNQGSVQRNTASAWEGDFKDGGTLTIPGNTKTGTVHDFSSTATPILGNIILSNGGFVYSLDWSDPLGASTNDYDIFIVNAAGTTVKAASTNIQNGLIDPHEEIGATAFTLQTNQDRIVVFKSGTAAVRALAVNGFGSRLTVFTPGQTHGHSSAAAAFSVAAANATSTANTTNGLFTTASRVETFSSDGPRRIFYNADGSVVTPGNILFATNGGVVRQKPDITAADAVATSGNLLGGGLNPFSGTSAAAPHAGAIAALIKSAKPSLTPAQIRTIMTTAVIDIEVAGVDNATGFGIVNANAAVLAAMSQQADLTAGPVTISEGSFKNSNGIVEPGETANIVVQLNNPSLSNALNVNATLTTSTPGVTVIQPAASYGTINAGGNASNTGTPFIIGVNQSVACATTINLSLTATLTNGTPLVFPITVNVGGLATVSATLTTPATGAGFTSTTGTEPSRVNRANPASTCAAPKAAPATTAGSRRYDAYVFTNPTGVTQCVTISGITSSSAAALGIVTYNNSGFVPATPAVNFLADSGNAVTNTHSFNVPAGQSFTTVIYEINANGGTGVTYNFNVVLGTCIAGPTCTPVTITTGSIASGTIGSPYSQSFAATGGSGAYTFSLTGSLPAGLGFSGNTLSGTPTQAGSFPITVTANDASCPSGSQSYTLIVSGIAPASITATAGNGQSVLPNTAFPIALQATVRDGGSNPLSGVAVTFAAPTVGASGTFTGGVSTVTVVTNGSGLATAPTFTANSTTGSYAVTATVNGITPVSFNLNNTCPGEFIVTSNADSGTGTLRDVINNACAGATVAFDPSVIGTITLTTGELTISKSIIISGPGAKVLAVSGNHLNRIFHIIPGTGNTVTISGLTIKDGSTKADGSDFFGGGGVLVRNGTVNLTDCVITGNDATASGNPSGGGLDNEGGIVTINRCSITNNKVINNVASNGAFYLGGGVFSQGTGSTMTITNSTISGNMAAPFGAGGGIAFVTATTLTNSTVFGNSANVGGNIVRLGSTLTFKNSIIAGGVLSGVNGSGVDISGTGFSSQDFNLIQTTTGGTITGTTTNNITGVSPNLLPLGDYGGHTTTLLPAPTSPVINAGDTALGIGPLDQRGFGRVVGGRADIGSVETNYFVTPTSGTPQSTIINTNFASPLQANVSENGVVIGGITVTFTAPASGASGLFGASLTATATTNASGIASAPTFTANGTTGMYNVTGSIGPAIVPLATYFLTNTGPAASITATAGTPQNTLVNQTFATPLQATVRDSGGTPVSGVTVTFTVVPNAGTSGTFPGNATSATAVTNINGQATAPTLTANNVGGTFTVNATAGKVGPAVFNLTVCGIACPSNIMKSTDANQCSAVVNYTTPTTAAGCGTVTCNPPSGATFQTGTTTVTCTLNSGPVTCSFTVKVTDSQSPSITCPANITKSTDPNQCTAVVTYAPPTVSDNCSGVGTPVCNPPSNSTFPKGTTTVNCQVIDAGGNQSNCSFTVTVKDMQAPTITCPANITKAVPPQCPLNTVGIAVSYTAPAFADNCPGATVLCTPPSGSTFPIGTMTVNCAVTDTSGNMATCSFKVRVFDVYLQDDTNPGNAVLFNSFTGEYLFCCNGQKYTGTGTVKKQGCTVTLSDNSTKRVSVTADLNTKKGNGTIQSPPGVNLCTITDRNMGDNTANCAYPN